MKKNFGMWMAIICILVVGVSVTKMTREFVVSQGVDAAAIVSVMDTTEMTVAGASMKQALKNQLLPPVEAAAGLAGGSAPEHQETMLEGGPAEAAPQEPDSLTTEVTENRELQDGAMREYAAVTSGEALIEEEAAAEEVFEADAGGDFKGSKTENEKVSKDTAAEAGEGKEPASNAEHDAIQETVKSPLNPVVNDNTLESSSKVMGPLYTAETFLARFMDIEESVEAIWQNVTVENHAANLAAAEQERVIWDSELNFIYSTIRSRMSDNEAEELKILEVEWLKERDLYAEKMAAKSLMKNAQNQNPAYTKALAEKTKERCYWLVSEYDGILNREEKPSEVADETILETKPLESGKESEKKVSPQSKK